MSKPSVRSDAMPSMSAILVQAGGACVGRRSRPCCPCWAPPCGSTGTTAWSWAWSTSSECGGGGVTMWSEYRAVTQELGPGLGVAGHTTAWLGAGAPHIRAVYTTPDKDTPSQVPLLLFLLEQLRSCANASHSLKGGGGSCPTPPRPRCSRAGCRAAAP